MIYFAVKILKNLCYHLNQRIYLIFGTDEENNWLGIAYYFKKKTTLDFDIVPDGISPMIYAEKKNSENPRKSI